MPRALIDTQLAQLLVSHLCRMAATVHRMLLTPLAAQVRSGKANPRRSAPDDSGRGAGTGGDNIDTPILIHNERVKGRVAAMSPNTLRVGCPFERLGWLRRLPQSDGRDPSVDVGRDGASCNLQIAVWAVAGSSSGRLMLSREQELKLLQVERWLRGLPP